MHSVLVREVRHLLASKKHEVSARLLPLYLPVLVLLRSNTNPVRAKGKSTHVHFVLCTEGEKCTALTPLQIEDLYEYVSTSIQGLVRVRKYKQEGESHGAQARKKVLVKQSKKCSCVPYPVLTPLVARTYPCFACKITGVSIAPKEHKHENNTNP